MVQELQLLISRCPEAAGDGMAGRSGCGSHVVQWQRDPRRGHFANADVLLHMGGFMPAWLRLLAWMGHQVGSFLSRAWFCPLSSTRAFRHGGSIEAKLRQMHTGTLFRRGGWWVSRVGRKLKLVLAPFSPGTAEAIFFVFRWGANQ